MGPLKVQAKDLVRTRRYDMAEIEVYFLQSCTEEDYTDISKSSIKCGHNYKLYSYEYRYDQDNTPRITRVIDTIRRYEAMNR